MKQDDILKRLLTRVVDDATADVGYSDARLWSLRSSLRKEILEAIDYKYDPVRAFEDEDYPR